MRTASYTLVYHPSWKLSEKIGVRVEFGFDSPCIGVFADGPWPVRSIEMTFAEYVNLVKREVL